MGKLGNAYSKLNFLDTKFISNGILLVFNKMFIVKYMFNIILKKIIILSINYSSLVDNVSEFIQNRYYY